VNVAPLIFVTLVSYWQEVRVFLAYYLLIIIVS
jgi:hypothetical protein